MTHLATFPESQFLDSLSSNETVPSLSTYIHLCFSKYIDLYHVCVIITLWCVCVYIIPLLFDFKVAEVVTYFRLFYLEYSNIYCIHLVPIKHLLK